MSKSRIQRFSPTMRMLLKSRYFIVGISLIVPVILLGVVGSLIVPYGSANMGLFTPRQPPSSKLLLGTDVLGRDVFAVLIHSIASSLQIGLIAGVIGIMIGIVVGFIAGYKGGTLGALLMDTSNVFLIIPTWPLLVVISTMVRAVGVVTLSLLIAAFSWPWGARIFRSQVLSLKERSFIDVAKLSGMGDLEIVFKEIMPNILSWLGAATANSVTWAMINEVSLEVIGLGPQGVTTLGIMLYWALEWGSLFRGLWWCLFPPVAALALIFIGLQLTNIGMDRVLNPRLRR